MIEVPGDTPILPVKTVVNAPSNAIEVPANTENILHVLSIPGGGEELDGMPDAETEAAAVNEEELEGDTSTTVCVSDGDNEAWGKLEGEKKLDGDTSA